MSKTELCIGLDPNHCEYLSRIGGNFIVDGHAPLWRGNMG